jgi:hypothetical protein
MTTTTLRERTVVHAQLSLAGLLVTQRIVPARDTLKKLRAPPFSTFRMRGGQYISIQREQIGSSASELKEVMAIRNKASK